MSSSGADEKDPPSSPANPPELNLALNLTANPAQTPPRPSPDRRRQNENPLMNNSPQRPRLITPQPQTVRTSELRTLFPPKWFPLRQTFPVFPPIGYTGPYRSSSFHFPHGIAPPPVPVGVGSSGVGGGVVVRPTALPGRGKDAATPSGPPVHCSVCNKVFYSQKALFGHMRSHPDRGWKGTHPPPTFNAEEEFADMPGVDLQALAEAVVAAEGDQGTGGSGEGVNLVAAGAIGEGEIVREAPAVGEIVEEVAAEGQQEEATVEQQQVAESVAESAGAGEAEQQQVAGPVAELAEALEAEQQQEAEAPVEELERVYRVPDLNETPTSDEPEN